MYLKRLQAGREGRTDRAAHVAWRFASGLPVVLALAACAQDRKLEPNFSTATLNREVPLTKSIVSPPPGGPSVVAVLQDIATNAVSQEIALSTLSGVGGQNAFYVAIFRHGQIGDGDIADRALKPAALRKEMLTRLPGVRMQVSNFYVQNKYGPFGYAVGRSRTGDLCMYGWQRIVPNKEPSPFFEGPAGAISVRLRICDARASEAALLSLMYGYTINAYYLDWGWNPYGQAPDVPPTIGQIGAPISPVGQEGLGSVLNGDTGPPARPSPPPAAVRRASYSSGYSSAPLADAAYPSPMRGYQSPGVSTGAALPPPPAAPAGTTYGASGGYAPPGTYAAPTARYEQPYQPTQIPPTPLTGYPVVPQPGNVQPGRQP